MVSIFISILKLVQYNNKFLQFKYYSLYDVQIIFCECNIILKALLTPTQVSKERVLGTEEIWLTDVHDERGLEMNICQ